MFCILAEVYCKDWLPWLLRSPWIAQACQSSPETPHSFLKTSFWGHALGSLTIKKIWNFAKIGTSDFAWPWTLSRFWNDRRLWEQPQRGTRFVLFVRARGIHCLMRTSLKRDARRFPFSLHAGEVYPFSFVLGRLPLFPWDSPPPLKTPIQL